MTARRWSIRRVAAGIAAVVCAVPLAAVATAASDTWCGPGLGGNWDDQNGRCTVSLVSRAKATMDMSLSVPVGLLDDATAGPILRDYALNRGSSWRQTGEALMHDNTSFAEPTVYTHSGALTSVVFHEQFHTVGTNPNDAYRTFTFDLQRGKLLRLADLFAPGVDPLTAIPPIARPYLVDALADAPPPHAPGAYPFTPDGWEPHADGSGYSGDYRAFAVTADELVIYMPDQPMAHENPAPRGEWQWSMEGGAVTMHVPLAALGSILAPGYAR